MKDFDDLLQQTVKNTHPNRALADNFTARVVSELRTHPTPRKESLFMKFWKKPLVAVLAGVVLVAAVGGTTYAATDGFTKPFSLNNIFGYKETETEQGRIVQVKTDNCSSVALTSAASTSDRTLYFRIAKDAKISTDDALKYVQGYCESLRQPVLPEVYTRLEKRDPARNTPSTLLATNGTVTRADAGTITISGGGAPAETYRKFASDAILESSSGATIKPSDIKVGRNVLLFARPSSSEAPDTVVYVRQASDEETLYLKFSEESSDYRRDVTRVEPCTSDPSGYCAVAQTPKPERPTPAPRTEKPAPAKPAPRTPSSPSSAQQKALATVKQAYEMYGNNATTSNKDKFIRTYTTPQLGAELRRNFPYDPILCVQQGKFKPRFGQPQYRGNTMSVTVRGIGQDGFPDSDPVDVTYDMTQGRISSIICRL